MLVLYYHADSRWHKDYHARTVRRYRHIIMEAKTPRIYGVLYIISIILFCLILLGGVVIYSAPHLGWLVDGVATGSMSPTITRGSLVIAKPVQTNSIALGDIIIYRSNRASENNVCHRVVSISTSSPLIFRTKGDANAFWDQEQVPAQNIIAKVVWQFPVIGFAAIFIHTPVGFIVSVVVPGFTIAFLCLSALRSELSGKKKGA